MKVQARKLGLFAVMLQCMNQLVALELVKRGHNVVTIRYKDTHDLRLKRPDHESRNIDQSWTDNTNNINVMSDGSFREIQLTLNNSAGKIPYVTMEEEAKFKIPSEILWSEGTTITTLFKVWNSHGNPWAVVKAHCNHLLGNQTLLKELRLEKFDLAIVDLLYNPCSLSLAAHYLNLPVVGYWAFSFVNGEADYTTASTPPSYIPTFMTGYTANMNFYQRVVNFIGKMFSHLVMSYHTLVMDLTIRTHFPESPSIKVLLGELNGALINTNNVLDYTRLQPPTFINIGGLQMAKEPLPKEIESFLDDSFPHGAILFTMGFIFDPSVVPIHRIRSFFEVFGSLKQNIVVKFDINKLPSNTHLTIPKNVMVLPFVPQSSILGHPNVKLFITHCGMHGVMESIYHEVPMVGMPVFIDQVDVLARIVEKGIGVGQDKWATSDEILSAINNVLSDKMFYQNIQQLSKIMKAETQKPMDRAITLLEYIVRTDGAEHLKLASRKLNVFCLYSIDVILFCLVFLLFIFKTVVCTLLKVFIRK